MIRADRFSPAEIDDDQYRTLLEFRTGLRSFLHWSEEQARAVGLSPAQHQLLLVVRAHPDPRGPPFGTSPISCSYDTTVLAVWQTVPRRSVSSATIVTATITASSRLLA